MSNLRPKRKRVASIMAPNFVADDDEQPTQPTSEVAHLLVPETQAASQKEMTTVQVPKEDLQAQQPPVVSYQSMTESRVRLEMGKMTRDQLKHAFIELSRSRQPPDEQMTSIKNGLDPTPVPTPTTKPIRSAVDQVLDLGTQLREYEVETNVVRASGRGEECMNIIKKILAKILGDVRGSLQGRKVDVDERHQLWLSSVDILYEIADLLSEWNIKVDGDRWIIQMLAELGRAMVTFSATSTNAGLTMTPMQSRQVTEICTSMIAYVEDLKAHIRGLGGEGEDLNDLGTAHTFDPSQGQDQYRMPLTMDNLSRLSGDENYRDQDQQTPSNTSSHYQDHYSIVSADLTTEGENFQPEAMARWAALGWGDGEDYDDGGNYNVDDEYSDDERLSYNSDFESPWH